MQIDRIVLSDTHPPTPFFNYFFSVGQVVLFTFLAEMKTFPSWQLIISGISRQKVNIPRRSFKGWIVHFGKSIKKRRVRDM